MKKLSRKRFWIEFTLGIVGIIALLTLALLSKGCGRESSTVKIHLTSQDPNSIIELTGEAANIISEQITRNMQTAQGRQNQLIESLLPYYGILFIIGLGGTGICLLLIWLKIPLGRFLWIVPIICFGGMAFIHFWSDYAKWIGFLVGGTAMAVIAFKLVEYKWERNNAGKKLEKLINVPAEF